MPDTNLRSKVILMQSIDDDIEMFLRQNEMEKSLIDHVIMNRNRIAKFLDMPTKRFRRYDNGLTKKDA